jgi:hypothetical protein
MKGLHHPALRLRDLRRIVADKLHSVAWDSGTAEDSEWIYGSLENDSYRHQLLQWLKSKEVPEESEAMLFEANSSPQRILWSFVHQHPEDIFQRFAFQLVSVDLEWILEYQNGCVARFGRWK